MNSLFPTYLPYVITLENPKNNPLGYSTIEIRKFPTIITLHCNLQLFLAFEVVVKSTKLVLKSVKRNNTFVRKNSNVTMIKSCVLPNAITDCLLRREMSYICCTMTKSILTTSQEGWLYR